MITWKERHYRYLRSWTWHWVRKRALHRAGYKCQRCGCLDHLEVHHLTYDRWGGKELPADLTVLCHDCHGETHGKPRAMNDPRHCMRPVKFVLVAYLNRYAEEGRGAA